MKALFFTFIWAPTHCQKNIDLEHLIPSTKNDFDIIAVSESRITKNKLPPVDISLPNNISEFCWQCLDLCKESAVIKNYEWSKDL